MGVSACRISFLILKGVVQNVRYLVVHAPFRNTTPSAFKRATALRIQIMNGQLHIDQMQRTPHSYLLFVVTERAAASMGVKRRSIGAPDLCLLAN